MWNRANALRELKVELDVNPQEDTDAQPLPSYLFIVCIPHLSCSLCSLISLVQFFLVIELVGGEQSRIKGSTELTRTE